MNKSIGNNLPRVKVQNQYAIKELVYKFGPISRIEIAERLGLTLPTITTSVSTMIKLGLLKEVDNTSSVKTLGRRTMLIDIDEDYCLSVGIEIRGTARFGVLVNTKGKVIAQAFDDKAYISYEESLESAVQVFEKLLELAKVHKEDIACVGLSTPGIVDTKLNKLVIHPGYQWADKSIAEDFFKLSDYRGEIYLDNNTISRAYGVSMLESQILGDADSLAYMFISYGIGCPLLSNVKEHFGIITGDGEVGHMVMNPDGPKCICGNRGCLEAYSSERAIIEKVKEVLNYPNEMTIDDVLEKVKEGNEEVKAIVLDAIEYLGLAIANIDNFVRPECVVIECKLFDEDVNRELLLQTIHQNLYRDTFQEYRFYFKHSDIYSGAKGIAAVAIKHHLEAFME